MKYEVKEHKSYTVSLELNREDLDGLATGLGELIDNNPYTPLFEHLEALVTNARTALRVAEGE